MFEHITKSLMKVKKDSIANKMSEVLIYSAVINNHKIEDIDFEQLNVEEIIDIRDNLFEIIAVEDEDGFFTFDANHPFTQLNSIQHKIHELETTPKQLVPSSFRFL